MIRLFFGDVLSGITTVLILGLLGFLAVSVARGKHVTRWGWRIVVAVAVGTALSALSATRDAFMTENVLFEPGGLQSVLCAVAGGLIYALGIAALFIRKQGYRRVAFCLIAALLLVQMVAVEGSRLAMAAGILL